MARMLVCINSAHFSSLRVVTANMVLFFARLRLSSRGDPWCLRQHASHRWCGLLAPRSLGRRPFRTSTSHRFRLSCHHPWWTRPGVCSKFCHVLSRTLLHRSGCRICLNRGPAPTWRVILPIASTHLHLNLQLLLGKSKLCLNGDQFLFASRALTLSL